jgi:hypothetical protein
MRFIDNIIVQYIQYIIAINLFLYYRVSKVWLGFWCNQIITIIQFNGFNLIQQ